jgi:hypothetical protein
VNARDLLIGHTPRRLDAASALAEFGGDDLHYLEALHPFRVTWRSQVIGEMR